MTRLAAEPSESVGRELSVFRVSTVSPKIWVSRLITQIPTLGAQQGTLKHLKHETQRRRPRVTRDEALALYHPIRASVRRILSTAVPVCNRSDPMRATKTAILEVGICLSFTGCLGFLRVRAGS
jgi:hypothetical protein